VPTTASQQLAARYQALAEEETRRRRVYFCGRLAQYRYFNTDEVITQALQCFQRIRQACIRVDDRSVLSPNQESSRALAEKTLTVS
jgi:hypothetical protein